MMAPVALRRLRKSLSGFVLKCVYPSVFVFQNIILHGRQDARQSVCLHCPEPTQRDSRVSRLPVHEEENGECVSLCS